MNNAALVRRLSVYYFFQKASFAYLMVLFTAMFLNNYGAAGMPWYFVGQAVFFFTVQIGIMRLTTWQGTAVLSRLLPGLGLVALLLAAKSPEIPAWTTFIALILARSGELLANQSFFDVSGQLLPVRESKKRLPGIMAAGTVGSVLAGLTLRFFMAEGKLGWFLAIAAVTFFLANYLLPNPDKDRQPAAKPEPGQKLPAEDSKLADSGPNTRKYVWIVWAMSAGGTLTCSLVDFLFSGRLAVEWSDSHEIATFLGLFNAMIELFSISVQALFGGWLFSKLPLKVILTIRPFTLGLLVLATWWSPVFFLVAASQFVMRTSTFIFMAPSWVLLLEPLPLSVRIYARRLLSIFDATMTMCVGIGLLVWTSSGGGADPGLYLLNAFFLLCILLLTRILIHFYPLMIQDTLGTAPTSEGLEAVVGIRFLPKKERLAYLQKLLSSDNNAVRVQAIQECAREADEDTLGILVAAMAREEHGPNLTLIVKVVTSHYGRRAGPLLAELINDRQEPGLLADLLEAIGRSDFAELEKTSAGFLDFPHRKVRGAAILNILRHGHDRGILLRAIERLYHDMRDIDPATRGTAAVVLGRTGLLAFLPALMAMVDDPVELPAIKAINALAHFRHPEVIEFLMSRSSLPGARGKAIARALSASAGQERPSLMKLLHELPEEERRRIEFWLHAPGSNVDGEIIGKLVHLEDARRRERLLQTLVEGDSRFRSSILKCLVADKNHTIIDSRPLWSVLAEKSWVELPPEAALIPVICKPEDPSGAEVLFKRLLEMAEQAWIIACAFPGEERSVIAPKWCRGFENFIKILALWGGEPSIWHDTIEKARSADKFLNSVAQEFLEARVGKGFARLFLPLLDGQKGHDDLRSCLIETGLGQIVALTGEEARNRLGDQLL